MRLPDFEAWAIFARVAQSGSFVAAAQELNLSQATVSKAVTRLEQKLGARLFHRTSRRLSLTDSGQAALDEAARLLAAGEALEAQASAQAAQPRGVVRMTAPLSFGVRRLGALLADFFIAYPEISLDLTLSDHFVDLVEAGVDVALRISELEDSSLMARKLAPVRVLPVASPDYFARHGRPQHPRDLADHICLIYNNGKARGVWRFRHETRGDYAVTVRGPLRVNNADLLGDMLLKGAGVAMQPDFLAWDDAQAGRLEIALPEWRGPELALWLVTPPGGARPARVEALIAFLSDRIRKADWAGRV
ncbi:MAG: LysR family transcriptional regulator [Asticcacaulis sp.]|uniref:LysR family transcriptional regulator n=1 Tax=Asticcacaulis sp. TaxID=1872648 RepID=UPI003F7CA43B